MGTQCHRCIGMTKCNCEERRLSRARRLLGSGCTKVTLFVKVLLPCEPHVVIVPCLEGVTRMRDITAFIKRSNVYEFDESCIELVSINGDRFHANDLTSEKCHAGQEICLADGSESDVIQEYLRRVDFNQVTELCKYVHHSVDATMREAVVVETKPLFLKSQEDCETVRLDEAPISKPGNKDKCKNDEESEATRSPTRSLSPNSTSPIPPKTSSPPPPVNPIFERLATRKPHPKNLKSLANEEEAQLSPDNAEEDYSPLDESGPGPLLVMSLSTSSFGSRNTHVPQTNSKASTTTTTLSHNNNMNGVFLRPSNKLKLEATFRSMVQSSVASSESQETNKNASFRPKNLNYWMNQKPNVKKSGTNPLPKLDAHYH